MWKLESTITPNMDLRFVKREGKMILQWRQLTVQKQIDEEATKIFGDVCGTQYKAEVVWSDWQDVRVEDGDQ